MLSSRSRKTKAAASALPKQATLFSFWSKKPPTTLASTKKKQECSDDSSSTPYSRTKRQRVLASVLNVNKELVAKDPLAITPEGTTEKPLARASSPHVVVSQRQPCNSNEEEVPLTTSGSENREVTTPSIVFLAKGEGNITTTYQATQDQENHHEKETQVTIPHSMNDYNDFGNTDGLSEYELLRLRNIARNNARLEALGLLPVNQHTAVGKPKTKRRPAKGSFKSKQVVTRPARRSTRLSRTNATTAWTDEYTISTLAAGTAEAQQVDIAIEEEQHSYKVSPVIQYEMEQPSKHQLLSMSDSQTSDSKAGAIPATTQRKRSAMLVPTGRRLAPPQGLSAIYSLNFFPDSQWIVGAGKAGIIALWNCDITARGNSSTHDSSTVLYVDPAFSWKAHSGRWVAEAQFLPSSSATATPSHLVTAGNDGSVCLWDLRQVSTNTGIPKLLLQSDKSWHAGGVFAMDVASNSYGKIVTGSKDKSVAIGNFSDLGRPVPTWRSHIHSGKVGAVKFKDDHVLATASDDGSVAVLDDRMPDGSNPPVALLGGLHQRRPHSVVWDKGNSVLLTAGLDSVIQAWDTRYLKHGSPSLLHEYFGHVPTTTRGCKRIHHPVLYKSVCGGRFILTGGQGSHALSIFHLQHYVDAGRPLEARASSLSRSPVYSRSSLPENCSHTDIGSVAVQQDLVAATVEGEVLLLRAKSQ